MLLHACWMHHRGTRTNTCNIRPPAHRHAHAPARSCTHDMYLLGCTHSRVHYIWARSSPKPCRSTQHRAHLRIYTHVCTHVSTHVCARAYTHIRTHVTATLCALKALWISAKAPTATVPRRMPLRMSIFRCAGSIAQRWVDVPRMGARCLSTHPRTCLCICLHTCLYTCPAGYRHLS